MCMLYISGKPEMRRFRKWGQKGHQMPVTVIWSEFVVNGHIIGPVAKQGIVQIGTICFFLIAYDRASTIVPKKIYINEPVTVKMSVCR